MGSGSLELWVWWEILRQNEDGWTDTALTTQVRGLEWDPQNLSLWFQPENVEKRSTETCWLGGYHDCWSSWIDWDILPQNKVEEWTRKNSDINLGLPYARTHMCMCIQTHVNMNTNTLIWYTWNEEKEKSKVGNDWRRHPTFTSVFYMHMLIQEHACQCIHSHIQK